ncbi:hypothetical protein MY4824_008435 [Beauveria thailandica]
MHQSAREVRVISATGGVTWHDYVFPRQTSAPANVALVGTWSRASVYKSNP